MARGSLIDYHQAPMKRITGLAFQTSEQKLQKLLFKPRVTRAVRAKYIKSDRVLDSFLSCFVAETKS